MSSFLASIAMLEQQVNLFLDELFEVVHDDLREFRGIRLLIEVMNDDGDHLVQVVHDDGDRLFRKVVKIMYDDGDHFREVVDDDLALVLGNFRFTKHSVDFFDISHEITLDRINE